MGEAIATIIMFLALGAMLILPIVILVRLIKRLRQAGEKPSGWAIAGRIALMLLSFFGGAVVALMMFGMLIMMSM